VQAEMKQLDIFTRIAIRVVLFCAIGMAMTFFGDYLRASGFFGDVPETRQVGCFVCDGMSWGARHYWYVWTCFALFVLGVVRIMSDVINQTNEADRKRRER